MTVCLKSRMWYKIFIMISYIQAWGFAEESSAVFANRTTLPICFSTPELRQADLAGEWIRTTEPPLYWNLSCSAEWSKYSCVHQGNVQHAKTAAMYRFVPQNCQLLDVNISALTNKLTSRRVIFSGDSFVRQVLISFSCLLDHHQAIGHKHLPWAPCGNKWPCHSTKKCIQCGPHSGFYEFDFSLKGSHRHPQFQFINEVNGGNHKGSIGIIKKGDIIFLSPGIFGTALKAATNAWNRVNFHKKSNVHVAWLHSWPAHFATKDGEYNITEILSKKLIGRNGTVNDTEYQPAEPSTCVEKSNFERKTTEADFLNQNDHNHVLYGRLWLNGIEKLGAAKVGNGAGALGDCQHFCLPGPPDEIARVIYTYLMTLPDI